MVSGFAENHVLSSLFVENHVLLKKIMYSRRYFIEICSKSCTLVAVFRNSCTFVENPVLSSLFVENKVTFA